MRTNEESFWYKGKPFTTEAVKTGPYVWHLTWCSNREKIVKDGILPLHGLVFANNVNDNINEMWHWDTEMEWADGSHLDYWRIDVRKARCRWYADINIDNYCTWGRYVCTPSPIPVEAITLFQHDDALEFIPEEIDEWAEQKSEYDLLWNVKLLKGKYEQMYIRKSEGAANCSLRKLPLKRVF
jgi:hypothetical protein